MVWSEFPRLNSNELKSIECCFVWHCWNLVACTFLCRLSSTTRSQWQETWDLIYKLSFKLPGNGPGKASYFLSIKIQQALNYIGFAKRNQIRSLVDALCLRTFHYAWVALWCFKILSTSKKKVSAPSFLYMHVIGVFIYITTTTRPYIALVTSMLFVRYKSHQWSIKKLQPRPLIISIPTLHM